jgi:hypothetical protein
LPVFAYVGVADEAPVEVFVEVVVPLQPASKEAPVAAMRETSATLIWFFMPMILFSHLHPMKMENDLFKGKKTLKVLLV